MSKVLFIEPLPALAEPIRRALPPEVDFVMVPSASGEDLARLAADADILVAARRPIDAQTLALASKARFIQAVGVGYDHIDVAAAVAAGIPVAYNPGFNAIDVAEHTILLMLVLLRQFLTAEQATRGGQFVPIGRRSIRVGRLADATVELIGLGNIGRAVAERLRAFDARVLYTARQRRDAETEKQLDVAYAPLPELLAACSIVSLHVPLTTETRYLIGESELALMPSGALLINTSRGGLIDEAALRRAIERGALGGAGLDVLEQELEERNPFADLPQVIVTPHTASASPASRQRATQMTVANIARFIAGEPVQHLVPGSAQFRS